MAESVPPSSKSCVILNFGRVRMTFELPLNSPSHVRRFAGVIVFSSAGSPVRSLGKSTIIDSSPVLYGIASA